MPTTRPPKQGVDLELIGENRYVSVWWRSVRTAGVGVVQVGQNHWCRCGGGR